MPSTETIYTQEVTGLTVRHIIREGLDPGHVYAVFCPSEDFPLDVVEFQHGGVADVGNNGLTNEVMLAVLVHRTKQLNAKFPCVHNEAAILHMEAALEAFNGRTRDRLIRGVEGQAKA